jgi:hypothetical protein
MILLYYSHSTDNENVRMLKSLLFGKPGGHTVLPPTLGKVPYSNEHIRNIQYRRVSAYVAD